MVCYNTMCSIVHPTPQTTRDPTWIHSISYQLATMRGQRHCTQAMDDQMAQVGAPGKVSALLVFLLVFPGVFRVFFLVELLCIYILYIYLYTYTYIQASSCVPGRGEFCQNGPPAFGAISVAA